MARPAPNPPLPDDYYDGEDSETQPAARNAPMGRDDGGPGRAPELPPGPAPTTAQLKENIDRGYTGEKVAVHDPAAAPLGTDDEAAGTPPSRAELNTAHREEVRKAPSAASQSGADTGSILYLVILGVFAAALSAAVVLFLF